MTINKFQGKTQEEAIEKAKAEFGPGAVIMNVKEIKPKGLFGFLKSSTYEVTAAIEEKESYAATAASALSQGTRHENINLSADEKIDIPKPVRTPAREELFKSEPMTSGMGSTDSVRMAESALKMTESQISTEEKFKERLDNISEMLEQKLSNRSMQEETFRKVPDSEEISFLRAVYSTLLKNEVNEKYINQILDEVEPFIKPGNKVDMILPNIYQKLILKFGQPMTIDASGKTPHLVFFIGPTGVGKTTTIAKIASKYKVEYNNKIAFITADTYRIAATEQLRVYADILDAPMSIVYTPDDLNKAIVEYKDYDLIFIDTAGFSHKNQQQREDTKTLLDCVSEEYKKDVYLVLSATTKYNDLKDIADIYHEIIDDYRLIFTKLDETSSYGNLLNIKLYANAALSYVTTGQNVPNDIEVFDTQKVVKQLLGGR